MITMPASPRPSDPGSVEARFRWRGATAMVLLSLALGGCALFQGKPPLPKYASVDAAAGSSSTENFAALVPDADVVYFPVERALHGGRSDPAARLLEALRQTGAPITIAWDLIDVSQQPLLDELQASQGAARERLIARLNLEGTGRAREYCRSVLRGPEAANIRHLALAPPPAVAAKVRSGETLHPDEQMQVPRGFHAPAGDMEAFSARLASTRSGDGGDVAGLYRAYLLADQFAAATIVRHFQSGGSGKLLVFLRQPDLEPGRGVPYFVTQKIQVRQLVLGSSRPAHLRAGLLRPLEDGRGRVDVVDGAPRAARE